MGSLRDIKGRIVSVKKTKKITQAMKMVAAAKFKRAQNNLDHSKKYGDALQGILDDMSTRMEPDNLPTVFTGNPSGKEVIILVTADRGLCGGFNTNIIKAAQNYIADHTGNPLELFIIGNKAAQFFKNKDITIHEQHTHLGDHLTAEHVSDLITPVTEKVKSGEIGKVTLFYNRFISAIANEQESQQVYPLALKDWTPNKRLENADYIYESGKEATLNAFAAEYVSYQIYQALLNSQASEEGSRMAAMDSATNNATDVIYDLSLEYNRSRQAAITTEISEIVAGATSLG